VQLRAFRIGIYEVTQGFWVSVIGTNPSKFQRGNDYPVGRKQPNAFGLYDTIGNVEEFCSDYYKPNYYKERVSDNPQGPEPGCSPVPICGERVTRGGGFETGKGGHQIYVTNRTLYDVSRNSRRPYHGLRLAMEEP
jgi:formylglycine-generating enzyme required for sulfatase activity